MQAWMSSGPKARVLRLDEVEDEGTFLISRLCWICSFPSIMSAKGPGQAHGSMGLTRKHGCSNDPIGRCHLDDACRAICLSAAGMSRRALSRKKQKRSNRTMPLLG